MFRSILAVLLGLFLAVVVILGIESVSSVLYPIPEGLDLND